VGGGLLVDAVDEDDGERCGFGLELEAELVDRFEDGDAIGAGFGRIPAPLDVEVPCAFEVRLVDDGAGKVGPRVVVEEGDEVGHGLVAAGEGDGQLDG
jgi:hypothetical protein